MHVRCDNLYKTGADRGTISGQPMLFVCLGICVLSLAHESEMRGYLVCADCKILTSLNLFKISHSILDWTALPWNFGGIFKNILKGSMDHIIYRDYTVNWRSFIYCSLAKSQ